MRLAILADIHGNLRALRAVMDDLARQDVTGIVNLGDCVSGPLWAAETAELLIAEGWPTVRGNHDRQVGLDLREGMYVSDAQAWDELGDRAREWLGGLPGRLAIGEHVVAVHARPDSDAKYLLEDVADGRLVAAPHAKVAHRLGELTARVVLTAHSHRAAVVRLPDGRTIVNPGSVGQPAYDDDRAPAHVSESGSPLARYAILDVDGPRLMALAFRAVPYDHEAAAIRADASGRPEWAHALRTGFMPLAK